MATNFQDVQHTAGQLWIGLNKFASQPLITFLLGGVSTLFLREWIAARKEKQQRYKLTKETLAKLATEIDENLKWLKPLQTDLEKAAEDVRRYSASDREMDVAIQKQKFQDHVFREHRATLPELLKKEDGEKVEAVYGLIDQIHGFLDVDQKYDQGFITNDHHSEKKALKLKKAKELIQEIGKTLAMGNPLEAHMLKPKT